MLSPQPPTMLPTRLSKFGVTFPFMIAPMVGISHVAFRELIQHYTPAGLDVLRFTEMLSTRRIPSQKLDDVDTLRHAPDERCLVPQLLGNEERFIRPSVERLMRMQPFAFDINMGCPVQHTLKHNWGVRLMGDADYAAAVVAITKRASPIPVSVKLRAGLDEKTQLPELLAFTRKLQGAGADWITLHARSAAAKHHGAADWRIVGETRSALTVPVIANGDIQTAADALRVVREFEVDGAMLARAAVARPWILWQIAEDLGYPNKPPGREHDHAPRDGQEEADEFVRACRIFLDLLCQYFVNTEQIHHRFCFFVATASKWFAFGHHFWRRCIRAKTIPDLRAQLHRHNLGDAPMYQRIGL